LEDRYFGRKFSQPLTEENMEVALGGRFQAAVELNLAHVPEEAGRRDAARTETVTPMNQDAIDAATEKRIRDRIAACRDIYALFPALEQQYGPIEEALGPIEGELTAALTKESPEKGEDLAGLDAQLYPGYSFLTRVKSGFSDQNKSKDHDIFFAGSVRRMSETFGEEFGKKLLAFKKKNLQPEDLLHEEDRIEMTDKIAAIEKSRVLLFHTLGKLAEMDATTDTAARIKIMTGIRLLISKHLPAVITAAEAFHNSKPKIEAVEVEV